MRAMVAGFLAALVLLSAGGATPMCIGAEEAGQSASADKADAAARLEEAKRLMNIGKLDETIAMCKEPSVIALGLDARQCLVKAYVLAARREEATAALKEMVTAFADDPKIVRAVTTIAGIYKSNWLESEALAFLNTAADKLTGASRVKIMAEAACMYIGKDDAKAESLIEIMKQEAKGNQATALCLMPVASKYLDLMDTGRAAGVFRWIKQEQGNIDMAARTPASKAVFFVDLCELLLRVRKGSVDPNAELARLCDKYGDWPELPDAMLKVGTECWRVGSGNRDRTLLLQGAKICETMISTHSDWSGLRMAYYIAALNRSLSGEHEKAIGLLDTALNRYVDPHHQAATLHYMGGIYNEMGNYERASYCWIKAVDVDAFHEYACDGLMAAAECYEKLLRDGQIEQEAADSAIRECYLRILNGYPVCQDALKHRVKKWLDEHQEM